MELKKKIVIIVALITFLSGCVQSTAMIGPSMTLVSSGNLYQAGVSYGANKAVEKNDYMYDVDVHESYFVIKQVWNEKYRERMVNMGAIVSGRITFNNFAKLGNQILLDAIKHKCRHFVRVYDKTGDSKKIWKANTKMLKNYFITWPP